MGIEEGEEIQTKGTDNLLNSIIAEKFSNLKKGGHLSTGFQNAKQAGSEKNILL
jgi:hypothetical protein